MTRYEALVGIYKNTLYDHIIKIAGSFDMFHVCINKKARELHFVKNLENYAYQEEEAFYLGGTALCLPLEFVEEYLDFKLAQWNLTEDEQAEAVEIVKEYLENETPEDKKELYEIFKEFIECN